MIEAKNIGINSGHLIVIRKDMEVHQIHCGYYFCAQVDDCFLPLDYLPGTSVSKHVGAGLISVYSDRKKEKFPGASEHIRIIPYHVHSHPEPAKSFLDQVHAKIILNDSLTNHWLKYFMVITASDVLLLSGMDESGTAARVADVSHRLSFGNVFPGNEEFIRQQRIMFEQAREHVGKSRYIVHLIHRIFGKHPETYLLDI